MPSPEERLAELGLELPEIVPPLAAYVPAVRSGDLVFTAGQIPMRDGTLVATGLLGGAVADTDGIECARQCALNALAGIRRVVKVVVFVAATPDFVAHPQIANGASELLGEVFGDAGRHARSAVGVSSLPLGCPVEVEVVVEVEPASGA